MKKSKRKDKEDEGKREEERAGHTYQHLACLSSLRMEMKETHTGLITFMPIEGLGLILGVER